MKRRSPPPAVAPEPAPEPAPELAPHATPLRYRVREGHLLQVDDVTSARMAGVRQKATRPERLVGSLLRALGQRYRLNNRDLDGSPDFANRRARWALFVHGCFWHRHGCSATTLPTRNREFWQAKFARNLARDARTSEALRAAGYRVIVIWECETKRGAPGLLERLRAAFAANGAAG
jgi:DNA mismatch endonuclease (patch repair protein)